MQRRESLLGAQPGKSVFQWSQRVKINLEPAMTRTVASKIKTVRTGNLRLPKYELIAAAERINANAGMDCLAPIAKNRKIRCAKSILCHVERSRGISNYCSDRK